MAKKMVQKRKRDDKVGEEDPTQKILNELQELCPTLFGLLDEFKVHDLMSSECFQNDMHYWQFEELKFYLLRMKHQSAETALDIILKRGESEVLTCNDKEQSMLLRSTLNTLISIVEEKIVTLLSKVSTTNGGYVPRIIRLAGPEYLQLKKVELELVKGLVLKSWSHYAVDIFTVSDGDDTASNEVIMKLIRMNKLELEEFSEDGRKHIEDATVIVTQHGKQKISFIYLFESETT
jgi:hypothetical protein